MGLKRCLRCGTLAAIPEEQGSITDAPMINNNHLECQSQGILGPLLASTGTADTAFT